MAAKKSQNKITEYRKMLLAWKAAGIWTYAGYILGFPGDTQNRSQPISKSSSANCRSIFWSSSSSRRCPDPKTTRRCDQGHRDGSRSEQVRSGTRRHRASENEPSGMGEDLLGCLAALLHAEPHRNDLPPRQGQRHRHLSSDGDCAVVCKFTPR